MNDAEVKQMLVRICDPDHPHFPEHGRLTGRIIGVLGTPMAEVKLDTCKHGTDACFVKAGQIEAVPVKRAVRGERQMPQEQENRPTREACYKCDGDGYAPGAGNCSRCGGGGKEPAAVCPQCGSAKQERIVGLWLCNACGHEWDSQAVLGEQP